jgi:hypothetical protein
MAGTGHSLPPTQAGCRFSIQATDSAVLPSPFSAAVISRKRAGAKSIHLGPPTLSGLLRAVSLELGHDIAGSCMPAAVDSGDAVRDVRGCTVHGDVCAPRSMASVNC